MSGARADPGWPRHVRARIIHARRGATRHAFRHDVDYVLVQPEARLGPRLFSVNRINFAAIHDRDHGGPRGSGRGAHWAREVFFGAGLSRHVSVYLLTQPRVLGAWFTPVSFWLAFDGADLVAVIAEVNNTFGHRHSYLCHHPGFSPITAEDEMLAEKVFHVSPFQDVAGTYRFRFDLRPDRMSIRIRLHDGPRGLVASMSGRHAPLKNRHIAAMAFRRPFGPVGVLALIHWHALRLWMKGARYRPVPTPPDQEVSS